MNARTRQVCIQRRASCSQRRQQHVLCGMSVTVTLDQKTFKQRLVLTTILSADFYPIKLRELCLFVKPVVDWIHQDLSKDAFTSLFCDT